MYNINKQCNNSDFGRRDMLQRRDRDDCLIEFHDGHFTYTSSLKLKDCISQFTNRDADLFINGYRCTSPLPQRR